MSGRPHTNPDAVEVRTHVPSQTPGHSPVRSRAGSGATRRVLTLVTAAGLGVDAYVHWQLAPGFDTLTGAASPHISQGQLFRLEAALSLIAMLLVLLTRNRLGAAAALLIAAGGLGAVLLYGYIDVGAFGPLPDMYDPIWYPEKTISAVAEAVAAVSALCLLLLPSFASDADG
jgi:hypothetical protein